MEVLVDDYGNGIYTNKSTTFETLGIYLISSHPIFNKLNEVYNDKTVKTYDDDGNATYDYSGTSIYLSGVTYFNHNPKSSDGKEYGSLKNNQTVQKDQMDALLKKIGLSIHPISKDSTYKQYVNTNQWEYDETNHPTYTETDISGFKIPSAKCKFDKTLDNFHCTELITCSSDKNVILNIIGKVRLPDPFKQKPTPYYTPEMNLWVGVLMENNIIAITELHNFKDNVAYFSMQIPMIRNKSFRIVIPFEPANAQSNGGNEDDIFNNIPENYVSLFYYS